MSTQKTPGSLTETPARNPLVLTLRELNSQIEHWARHYGADAAVILTNVTAVDAQGPGGGTRPTAAKINIKTV